MFDRAITILALNCESGTRFLGLGESTAESGNDYIAKELTTTLNNLVDDLQPAGFSQQLVLFIAAFQLLSETYQTMKNAMLLASAKEEQKGGH